MSRADRKIYKSYIKLQERALKTDPEIDGELEDGW